MCLKSLEMALDYHKPKAVIVVDIYGQSADYLTINQICNKYNVPIIEDAAESLVATYNNKKCENFGEMSILSFNGNKIMTTGGGGMLLSNNENFINKARKLSTQAREFVGDAGGYSGSILTALVNGSADGAKTFTTGNDNGTYTSLVVSDDNDIQYGQSAFPTKFNRIYKGTISNASALAAGVNCYKLSHDNGASTTTSGVLSFVVDTDMSSTPSLNAYNVAMNSNGKDSHPLKRGIWLLENLLNDPPPPPPPDPPKIDLTDPEILKLTLKQRMEDHRNDPACISCHVKIDPWGIAFENFDAVGKWRDTIGRDPVDATSVLFNKHELRGMQGLKEYLLANRQDQFARAMAHKMAAYALGRPLTFGDRSQVDRITAKLRKQGDGLADLVFLIVKSDLFQLN